MNLRDGAGAALRAPRIVDASRRDPARAGAVLS
jgi:hypothetical protein